MCRRYLIAPDKFKGSLSAPEAAAAMADGIRRVDPKAEIDLCPIADGGEGFMEALALAIRGKWITCPAVDPLGREIESRYVLAETPDGLTAILEMAETSGLWRLKPEEQNPLFTSTRGTGMQITHAVSKHAVKRIILGIGGSATNDGGAGMASAIGIKFFDEDDLEFDPVPTNLSRLCRVDTSTCIEFPEIIAACDVDNPLLGRRGATAVFSTQKGASEAAKITLEMALTHLVSKTNSHAAAQIPGAGAAGGLGFGLLHFTNAKLVSGFDLLADLLNLQHRIKAADHVLTGEGSLDVQSLSGKGPVALARLAKSLSVPVTAFCGIADETIRNSSIFDDIYALADSELPMDTLISQAGPLLVDLVANSIRPNLMKTPFITEAETMKEEFDGRTNVWVCHPKITNAKDLQICRANFPPGEGHSFHHHPELEEVIYVIEGEIEQWVGKEKHLLKVGEVAHILPGVVHATFNVSQTNAVILAILSPGSTSGPALVDVSKDEPWASIRG